MQSIVQSTPDARWAAVTARRPGTENAFIYAVITTGIFCRPTCSARLARRSNVRFFDTVAQAKAANFRPCKRCKPDQPVEDDERQLRQKLVSRACDIIEAQNGQMTAAKVAEELGVSSRHLYAVFRSVNGESPGTFAEAVRKRTNVLNEQPTGTIHLAEFDQYFPTTPLELPDLIPGSGVDVDWPGTLGFNAITDAGSVMDWWEPGSIRLGTISPSTISDSPVTISLSSNISLAPNTKTEMSTPCREEEDLITAEYYSNFLTPEMIQDIDRTLREACW